MIEVQHVSKHYRAHTALDDVSLTIERGRVFGLLGPNGAGKTTLIRMINNIIKPDSGTILFDGKPLSTSDVVRIGYLPEERGLYRKMKVGEHAIYLARLKGLSSSEAKRRLESWFEKFGIMPWWDKRVEELSKGMQQKVQFICTGLHEPELLIFEEPFSRFDPVDAELLKSEIIALRERGSTLIFSTHNMQSVEELCDDIALINQSHLVLSGSVTEVRARYRLPYYRMTLAGEWYIDDFGALPIEEYRIEHNQTYLRLKIDDERGLRDLLGLIPMEYPIVRLEHEEPTMNEIFIKTVSGHE